MIEYLECEWMMNTKFAPCFCCGWPVMKNHTEFEASCEDCLKWLRKVHYEWWPTTSNWNAWEKV